MALTIRSLLEPIDTISEAEIAKYREACEKAAFDKATQLWGNQNVTIRDLNASDMSYTNNVFTETSNATVNQWNTMAFGAFSVAQSTIVGIYGVKIDLDMDGTIDFSPISGIRIDVGGARVAQWHTQSLDVYNSAATLAGVYSLCGITKSPIVIGETLTVTIYEYTRTASTVYVPVWLGVTVEKEGITLRP